MTLTQDITSLDETIQQLEREAAQAQTSSSVSGSEAAIAQKAIRELTTAKAEILAKASLWDRNAQLQRARADRKAVADRVRLALAARGSLEERRKLDLTTALKAKAGIPPTNGNLDAVYTAATSVDDARKTADTAARDAVPVAARDLARKKLEYAEAAANAEAAWAAIQNSARSLDEQFNLAQQQLAEADALTAAVATPTAPPLRLNPAAAEAGLAWKDFVVSFDELKRVTTISPGASTDPVQAELERAWGNASLAAKNALAELLRAQKDFTEKQKKHELRQSARPGRSASERQEALVKVREKLTPP